MRTPVLITSLVGALVLTGGVAVATLPNHTGAQEAYTVAKNDTISLWYSIKTDTVLKVVGKQIVARGCGTGFIYLRSQVKGVVQSADTIAVTVQCTITPPTSTTGLTIVDGIHHERLVYRDSLLLGRLIRQVDTLYSAYKITADSSSFVFFGRDYADEQAAAVALSSSIP